MARVPSPEKRLYGSMIAGPMLVIGVFWMGWTGAYPDVHWAAPAVSLVLIGMSVSLVFISFLVCSTALLTSLHI